MKVINKEMKIGKVYWKVSLENVNILLGKRRKNLENEENCLKKWKKNLENEEKILKNGEKTLKLSRNSIIRRKKMKKNIVKIIFTLTRNKKQK